MKSAGKAAHLDGHLGQTSRQCWNVWKDASVGCWENAFEDEDDIAAAEAGKLHMALQYVVMFFLQSFLSCILHRSTWRYGCRKLVVNNYVILAAVFCVWLGLLWSLVKITAVYVLSFHALEWHH